MRNLTAGLMGLVSMCSLTACEKAQSKTFYVTVPVARTSQFVRDLSALASDVGLQPKAGSATDDNGHALNVVEGSRAGLRLWAQNQPLSPDEARRCGLAGTHEFDPQQFVLSFDTMWPWLATATQKTGNEMERRLMALGYEVATRPREC